MSNVILQELLDGNVRFVEGKNGYTRVTKTRRLEGVHGQRPKAIILGCADSRVVPEFLFDQGIGDLFVIRVAGNILDDAIIGSIEYAVSALEASLLIVLGHTHCGAVEATVNGKDLPGKMGAFTQAIRPSLCNREELSEEGMTEAVVDNAIYVAKNIEKEGTIIPEAIAEGKLMVVPALYTIETGKVEVIKKG